MYKDVDQHSIRWWHRLYLWILPTRSADGLRYKVGFGRLWVMKER